MTDLDFNEDAMLFDDDGAELREEMSDSEDDGDVDGGADSMRSRGEPEGADVPSAMVGFAEHGGARPAPAARASAPWSEISLPEADEEVTVNDGSSHLSSTMPVNQPVAIRSIMRTGGAGDYLSQSLSANLGSSVPIAIPMMGGRGLKEDGLAGVGGGAMEGDDEPPFIPPHMMTPQTQSGVLDFLEAQNLSMESHFRRDRLKIREAVLRSTGFLEPSKARESMPGMPPPITEKKSLGALASALSFNANPPVIEA